MFDWYEIVGLIGATLIFTSAYIFDAIRMALARLNNHLGVFAACSMCVGFWVGVLYSYFFRKDLTHIEMFLFGCCISILSYATDYMIILIERITSVLLQKANINSEKDRQQNSNS